MVNFSYVAYHICIRQKRLKSYRGGQTCHKWGGGGVIMIIIVLFEVLPLGLALHLLILPYYNDYKNIYSVYQHNKVKNIPTDYVNPVGNEALEYIAWHWL